MNSPEISSWVQHLALGLGGKIASYLPADVYVSVYVVHFVLEKKAGKVVAPGVRVASQAEPWEETVMQVEVHNLAFVHLEEVGPCRKKNI